MVAAAALALGVAPRRSLVPPWLALFLVGGATAASSLLAQVAASALVWSGASLDTGAIATTFSRVLLGGLVLVPLGLLAGVATGSALEAPPRENRRRPAWLVAAAGIGVAAALAPWLLGSDTPGWAPAVVLVVAGTLRLFRSRQPASTTESQAAPLATPDPSHGPIVAAFGVAAAAAAFTFLSGRALQPAFASTLDVPVGAFLFVLGLAAGALVAGFAPGGRGVVLGAAGALLAAAAVALVTLTRFDGWPTEFMEAVADQKRYRDVLVVGLRIAVRSALPVGFLVGLAAGLLVGARAPGEERRPAAALAAAVVGAGAGALFSRFALVDLGLTRTIVGTAFACALAGGVAAVRSGPISLSRVGVAGVGIALVAVLGARVPSPDREGLVVDRYLRSSVSLGGVPKSWTAFDVDDAVQSTVVLRRGHAKRLFVDGRFAMSNVREVKSHGMLAHVPLILHPDPRRVLVLGSGNGLALRAALAHPIDRADCFATTRAPVRATAHCGPVARRALRDARLRVRVGDPQDLVQRTRVTYDVILNQELGVWNARAARLCTREFLELVKQRLADEGLYCCSVPGSRLTKEGFRILLATFAAVFPSVEVWAGQGGDTLFLARTDGATYDFENVEAAYADPSIQVAAAAAWIEDPITLLCHYLLSDEGVRRLTAGVPVHERGHPVLATAEVSRRLTDYTIDPVPGLAEVRSNPVAAFTNPPDEPGFAAAIDAGVQARALQREALDLELRNEDQNALSAYFEALELNPRDGAIRRAYASLRSRIGIRYAREAQYTVAHGNLREAVEIDTTYAQGFANLGRILVSTTAFDYALSVTHQATLLEPDDELFQAQMGAIWKVRGYFDRALPYYENAMILNPNNVEAAMGYLDAKLSMEDEQADLEAGLEFLERYRPLEPRNEDLLYRIGKLKDAIERGLTKPEDFDALAADEGFGPAAPESAAEGVRPDPHAGHDHD